VERECLGEEEDVQWLRYLSWCKPEEFHGEG